MIDLIKLVLFSKVKTFKGCYDMTGKRYVYCNGDLINYRKIMKLKRLYRDISIVAVMILIVAYAFIVKSIIG